MAEEKKKTKDKFSPVQKNPVPKFKLNTHNTEKAATGEAQGVYTFRVSGSANKKEIFARIKQDFKVTPIKVRIINLPKKPVVVMGRRGIRGGIFKALVYLKQGDKITHPVSDKK